MSKIETILTRMINEPSFAEAVFADMEKALSEYDLSAKEMDEIKEISRMEFEAFVDASPEERKSMGRTWGPSTPMLHQALTNNENV